MVKCTGGGIVLGVGSGSGGVRYFIQNDEKKNNFHVFIQFCIFIAFAWVQTRPFRWMWYAVDLFPSSSFFFFVCQLLHGRKAASKKRRYRFFFIYGAENFKHRIYDILICLCFSFVALKCEKPFGRYRIHLRERNRDTQNKNESARILVARGEDVERGKFSYHRGSRWINLSVLFFHTTSFFYGKIYSSFSFLVTFLG